MAPNRPEPTVKIPLPSDFYIQEQQGSGNVQVCPLVSRTTAFPHTEPQVLRWLEKCCDTHVACNATEDRQGWNPTRLLDVGRPGEEHIQLIDNTTRLPELRYLTLSHTWGNRQFRKLHSSTISLMRSGIKLAELSRTFRDAVKVTRSLNIQYLWIDSLCIIQDPDTLSDWARESSRMYRVYSHAFCNISATGACDSEDGLFFDRRPDVGPITTVDFVPPVDRVPPDLVDSTPHQGPYTLYEASFWENHVAEAPVNQRGWVLQERLLSKRVIHFTGEQVSWECHELDATEAFPAGLSVHEHSHYSTGFKNLSPSGKIPAVAGSADPSLFGQKLWCRIVNTYTKCSLTKPKDTLVAIAGIARRMQLITQDEYIAGMWRGTLESGLFWRSHFADRARPARWRAPTWSWASVDGPVIADLVTTDHLRFKVLEVRLDYVTEDVFGLLRGGWMLLQGRLKQVTIHYKQVPWHIPPWYASFADISVEEAKACIAHIDIGPINDFEERNKEHRLFAMPGFATPDEVCPWMNEKSYALLFELQDSETGTFNRIGVVHIESPKAWELLCEGDYGEEMYPCVNWDAEKRLHTIRVI